MYIATAANAIKVCGSIVRLTPDGFLKIIEKNSDGVTVVATGGFLTTKHKYLTSYKGLVFFCQSKKPLPLPEGAEVIAAEKMVIPDL